MTSQKTFDFGSWKLPQPVLPDGVQKALNSIDDKYFSYGGKVYNRKAARKQNGSWLLLPLLASTGLAAIGVAVAYKKLVKKEDINIVDTLQNVVNSVKSMYAKLSSKAQLFLKEQKESATTLAHKAKEIGTKSVTTATAQAKAMAHLPSVPAKKTPEPTPPAKKDKKKKWF